MFNIRKLMEFPLVAVAAIFLFGNFNLEAACCGQSHSHDDGCGRPKPIKIVGQAAPGVKRLVKSNNPFPYNQIYQNLTKDKNIPRLEQDLINLYNFLMVGDMSGAETAYQKLFQDALSIANNYCPARTARVVITASNGVVAVDTQLGPENTLDNFIHAQIEENFNTRIAILDAQAWPAGVGVETQFNFVQNKYGSAVAIRLGPYLANQGTVRLTVFL